MHPHLLAAAINAKNEKLINFARYDIVVASIDTPRPADRIFKTNENNRTLVL